MKIEGICYIAKKYKSDEIDFRRFDKFATGKICWGDNIKDKSGTVTKSYTNKNFICFDRYTIDVLDGCRRNLLVIEGQLRTEYYLDKETSEKKKIEKVIINKARIYDKNNSSSPEPSQNDTVEKKSIEDIDYPDDDIPF
jgi:hypothetical protein